jgi:hypothetical protein
VGRPDAQIRSTGVQHKLSVTAHADSASDGCQVPVPA